jgi:hypothetical protein
MLLVITDIGLGLHQAIQRIQPEHRVLDVGGAMRPLRRADVILDFMPYTEQPRFGYHGDGPICYTPADWYVRDICDKTPWPFKDKSFDFVLCRHTLEDIRDPIYVCQEMVRVGKAGYIETPHRDQETTTGIDAYPGNLGYAGYCHHRWLVTLSNDQLVFTHKSPFLHAEAGLRKWSYKQTHLSFFWVEEFDAREKILLSYEDIIADQRQWLLSDQGEKRPLKRPPMRAIRHSLADSLIMIRQLVIG